MFIAFFWAIFLWVYVSDKKESAWLWILAWFIFFIIVTWITISISNKKHEEEVQKCNNYLVNPYYSLDVESIWYEYAAKWSSYCDSFLRFDIEDLAYSNDNYLKWELSYWCDSNNSDKFIDCIEYNISRFEEGCDEYRNRKDLKNQCLHELERKKYE